LKIFIFYPNELFLHPKSLTCGSGGAVVFLDKRLAGCGIEAAVSPNFNVLLIKLFKLQKAGKNSLENPNLFLLLQALPSSSRTDTLTVCLYKHNI
jgi:hypothetical protein